NGCYKAGKKRSKTTGIVKHSTGANNPYLRRYIDDPGNLGENTNNNHWNRPGVSTCVHFMIGKDKAGKVAIYQLLPLDYRCWGCGSGPKGSYNASHVQYEICEDGLTDRKYFEEAFAAAAWLDAYICKKYGLKASSIVSHKEAHEKGYATNHGDCDHWLAKQGKSMDWTREQAEKAMDGPSAGNSVGKDTIPAKDKEEPKKADTAPTSKVEAAKSRDLKLAGTYTVATKTDPLALRAGAGTGKPKVASLAKGSKVQCYGYYTEADGVKWLLVTAGDKNGFVHGGHLKKI
ncbi:MAG TPA: hypothetical protein DF613_02085, partial [Lachnospiraceae bacterium]|nr:hypothetical protein [Lachnospiraceae bacterium]